MLRLHVLLLFICAIACVPFGNGCTGPVRSDDQVDLCPAENADVDQVPIGFPRSQCVFITPSNTPSPSGAPPSANATVLPPSAAASVLPPSVAPNVTTNCTGNTTNCTSGTSTRRRRSITELSQWFKEHRNRRLQKRQGNPTFDLELTVDPFNFWITSTHFIPFLRERGICGIPPVVNSYIVPGDSSRAGTTLGCQFVSPSSITVVIEVDLSDILTPAQAQTLVSQQEIMFQESCRMLDCESRVMTTCKSTPTYNHITQILSVSLSVDVVAGCDLGYTLMTSNDMSVRMAMSVGKLMARRAARSTEDNYAFQAILQTAPSAAAIVQSELNSIIGITVAGVRLSRFSLRASNPAIQPPFASPDFSATGSPSVIASLPVIVDPTPSGPPTPPSRPVVDAEDTASTLASSGLLLTLGALLASWMFM